MRSTKLFLGRNVQWLDCVKLEPLRTIWSGQKLLTETPKSLEVPDVTVKLARFFSILRRQGSLKINTDRNKYDIRKRSINCYIYFTVNKFYSSYFRNLLEGLFTDQIYGFNIRLFYYCLVCYCIVYICITFVRQESE